jgi:hypothetical protein
LFISKGIIKDQMAEEDFSNDLKDNDIVGWLVKAPAPWAPLLRLFRLPVVAFGEEDIYRVLLLGEGFQIKNEGDRPLVGFYTTRFVTAETIREAQLKAKHEVLKEWKQQGWDWIATSDPALSIEEIDRLPDRFFWRGGSGFGFFPAEEDEK